METFKALLTRRSVRQYTEEKIPNDKIEKLLEAAMYAPSAFNLQSWEFIVLDDKETIEKIIKAVPHASMLSQASHAIVVCGDNEKEKDINFLQQNCSAATQNILLAAHDLGIGCCWIALFPIMDVTENVKKLFNLPGKILPVAVVSLGYPAEAPVAEERFIKEKIHFNKW